MKILVTGMTSYQTTEARDEPARWIAECLRAGGHDVTVAKPSLASVLDGSDLEWDHVVCGLGPLHGLGTSSMYGALGMVGVYGPKHMLTLYADDLSTGKIGGGLRVMHRVPARLVKPFYVYKREWELARHPEVHAWLSKVVAYLLGLAEEDAPPIIVPAYRFDSAFMVAQGIVPSLAGKAVAADFSSFIEPVEPKQEWPVVPWWATEHKVDSKDVMQFRTSWEVHQVSFDKNLEEAISGTGFLHNWGGWSKRFKQCVDARLPVATDWRAHAPSFGEPYEALAPTIETMSPDEHIDLIEDQASAFLRAMTPKDEVYDIVNRVVGR